MRDGVYWSSKIERRLLRVRWEATVYRANRVDVTSSGSAWTRSGAEARCDAWLTMMGEVPS